MKRAFKKYFLQFQYYSPYESIGDEQRKVLPASIIMGIAFLPLVPFSFIAKYGIVIFLYPFKVLANWFNK